MKNKTKVKELELFFCDFFFLWCLEKMDSFVPNSLQALLIAVILDWKDSYPDPVR